MTMRPRPLPADPEEPGETCRSCPRPEGMSTVLGDNARRAQFREHGIDGKWKFAEMGAGQWFILLS